MKSKALKEKALALYINNLSLEKISKQCKVSLQTIKRWKKQFKWKEAREEAIQKSAQKVPEIHSEIIQQQVKIVNLAQTELLKKLEYQPELRKQIDEIKRKFGDIGKLDKEDFLSYVSSLGEIYKQLMYDNNLINIMKHGLEVVRPKTQAQFNFMKHGQDSGGIKIIIEEKDEK